MVGEECGQMLNRSWFSAGCGTITHTSTLRMLEIPSSRCCLITEDIKMTRAMGFVDGENCLMTDGKDIVERVRELLDDKPRLTRIIDAGYELVRSRHGASNRRVFREYYDLLKAKRPDQRIIQPDAFKSLTLAGINDPMPDEPYDDCPLFEMIQHGYVLLGEGNYKEAMDVFRKANAHVPYNAESLAGIALCLMKLGDYEKAFVALINTYRFTRVMHSPVYDPVSQALTGFAALRAGKTQDAVQVLALQPGVRHPALDAARFVVVSIIPELIKNAPFSTCNRSSAPNLDTMHVFPPMDFDGWVNYYCWLGKKEA